MHRMRRYFVSVGLPLTVALILTAPGDRQARAELIQPNAPRTYPEIAGDTDGALSYTYNPTSQTGDLHLANTPLMLAAGPIVADELTIQPNPDGTRSQVLDVTLDSAGKLVAAPGNTYELYGTIVAGGQTYSGLLLKGVPTAFGAQPRDPLDARSSDAFDLGVKITGGQLAAAFGPDAYMQIVPKCESTFTGSFHQSFTSHTPTSTFQAEHAPSASAIPEPTTLALCLAGGCGLAMRRRIRSRQ